MNRTSRLCGLLLGAGLALPAHAGELEGDSLPFSIFGSASSVLLQPEADTTEAEAASVEEALAGDEKKPPATWFDGWEGSVSLGLNGSEGNTERLSVRAGIAGQRVVEDKYDTRFNTTYVYASEDGNKTEHRFRGELRNDWLFKNSPWRVFAQGAVDVDEFKDWEWRLQGYGGVGYEFIKNDKTELIGRAGLGASREFGGDDKDVQFEALLGVDFAHQITERQKISLTGELYPNLSDGGEFRALGRAAYEILVDPESGLSLKLGIEDRYDSDPGEGIDENDFDYFALLVWSF